MQTKQAIEKVVTFPIDNKIIYDIMLSCESMPEELEPCADASLPINVNALHRICKDYTTED